ncbi:ParB N-terminal domain-containing protein [Anaerosinus sp.]|uniref:hypothetical protein n=1 Tax=Selenobaculum sp. TaxID=3074374 RepID=UPI003AB48928
MTKQGIYKLKIDTSFKKLISPLSSKELLHLEENIIRDGCREPLLVWYNTILDGHNRYEICTKLQIPFMVQRIYFKSREEAIIWICANQLSHRNLTEEMRRYLLGKRSEMEKIFGDHNATRTNQYSKKEFKANRLPKIAFDVSASQTRERLSKEYLISQATILSYEKYTQALDLLSKIIPEIVSKILSNEIKLSLENTIIFSQLSLPEIKELSQLLPDNCKEFTSNIRQIILKRKNVSESDLFQIPVCSIKEMPAYDPDAEISSLTLTIPSWISSINRTRSTADFSGITDTACRKLEKELAELKETINNMLVAIKEIH